MQSIGWKKDSKKNMHKHFSITLPIVDKICQCQKHISRKTDSTMSRELMNTSRKYENVGTFVWNNLTHNVTVRRDYLNYSESGMPYVVDHFELHVTDVNGNQVKSPLTETGYRSYMLARKSEHYGGTTHCDEPVTNEQFLVNIKEKLGEEPKQKELML